MNIKKRIESLETLVSEIKNMSHVERLMAYTAIKAILDEIDAYVDEHESEHIGYCNAGIYITEIYYPLESVVGLDDNGHSESQNLSWIRTSIDKLRSGHCFNIPEISEC